MSERALTIEYEDKIFTILRDFITIRLKPDVVARLRESVKDDGILAQGVSTLLEWAHYPIIPLSDITDVSVEMVPVAPGSQERMRLVIKSRYHGGQRLYEFYSSPDVAQRLAHEIKKRISAKF